MERSASTSERRAPETPEATRPSLPSGVRVAIDLPLLSYASYVSGLSGGATAFRVGGGSLDIGAAASELMTLGVSLGVDYRSVGDTSAFAADALGYVDFAPPSGGQTRFFLRPEVGGTAGPYSSGWIVGIRLGARVTVAEHATVEPWAELRYSGLSIDVTESLPSGVPGTRSIDVGAASFGIGLSLALWGSSTALEAEPTPNDVERPARRQDGWGQHGWAQSARPRTSARPAAPPARPAITMRLRSGEVALELVARPEIVADQIALRITRDGLSRGETFDACREARFLAGTELIFSVPIELAAERVLTGRIPAGRLPALFRATRVTLDLCGVNHPLSGATTALGFFLQRFETAGGVADETVVDATMPAPVVTEPIDAGGAAQPDPAMPSGAGAVPPVPAPAGPPIPRR